MSEKMSVDEIKKYTFKINVFDTFPLEEIERIGRKMKEIGYDGCLVDNGNLVFSKKKYEKIEEKK